MITRAKARVVISVCCSVCFTLNFDQSWQVLLQSHQFLILFDFLSLITTGLASNNICMFFARTRSKKNDDTLSIRTRCKILYMCFLGVPDQN